MNNLQERITEAANRAWKAIGGDILQAAEQDNITREEVISCVADADYLEDFGNDREAVAEFRKLSYEEQEEILLKAFPFSRYGW